MTVKKKDHTGSSFLLHIFSVTIVNLKGELNDDKKRRNEKNY